MTNIFDYLGVAIFISILIIGIVVTIAWIKLGIVMVKEWYEKK